MKKLILLSASILALNAAVPIANVYGQNNNSEVIALTQEHKSFLQTSFEEAIELYQASYPNAEITDVDIHLHQETNQFIVRVLGREGSTHYQLITYNGENYFASRQGQDDDDDLAINMNELAQLDLVTQNAMDHAQSDRLVNWSLNSDDDLDDDQNDDDDDDRLSWELSFIEDSREIEVEVDALTGDVIDRDDDRDDDDAQDDNDNSDDNDSRHYYRQFYSDYSGSRPRVIDNNYYFGDDDDWDDDDWDDDDWDDDDWDDDDWDDDDWDDDDWDDDDWDDDDWDD